jgi:hypothetical protein
LTAAPAGNLNSLVQQGFCMIFTRCVMIVENVALLSSLTCNRENPCLPRLLREFGLLSAPIPVTRLWTPCTRLKIRELRMQSFH